MHYIVLDLEWNQPSKRKYMVTKPIPLFGEIIQFGAVKLDEQYRVLDTFKIMVAPKFYKEMHKDVGALTGITQEELQYGFPFPVACKHFRDWCGEDYAVLTWGPDDVAMLRSNLCLHKMKTRWIPQNYDIQILFDHQIAKENRQVSLSYAMEKIGEPALKAHDALNDAKNTACICRHLDMDKGLAEYAELKERMPFGASHPWLRSELLKSYATEEEALQAPEVIEFVCPKCGGRVRCQDFFRQNMVKFIAIGKCESGEELFVRFKFRIWPDGRMTVARILHEMDESNRAYYMNKKRRMEEVAAEKMQSLSAG